MDLETRQLLIAEGVAPMQGIHETLNAIHGSAKWVETRTRFLSEKPKPLLPAFPSSGRKMLTEGEGKRWLSENKLNVPRGREVAACDVANVADEVGYPVALKLVSSRLAHKTEAGAVALNLKNEDALHKAVARMKVDVTAYNPKVFRDLFLVEAMAPAPLAEFIITLRSDPQFGAVLVIGSGGIFVELIADSATLLLPTNQQQIIRALKSLRISRLLEGFRGRNKADLNKVANEVHRLCLAYQDNYEILTEIEINPLFVYPDHVCAVDVLIHSTVED